MHCYTLWLLCEALSGLIKTSCILNLLMTPPGPWTPVRVGSDYAGCGHSRKIHTGYVLMLNGAAISWKFKRQSTVSLSSAENEYIAASHSPTRLHSLVGVTSDLQGLSFLSLLPRVIALTQLSSWGSPTDFKHNARTLVCRTEVVLVINLPVRPAGNSAILFDFCFCLLALSFSDPRWIPLMEYIST